MCTWRTCALLYVSQKRGQAEVPPTRSGSIAMSSYPQILISSYPPLILISSYPMWSDIARSHVIVSDTTYMYFRDERDRYDRSARRYRSRCSANSINRSCVQDISEAPRWDTHSWKPFRTTHLHCKLHTIVQTKW